MIVKSKQLSFQGSGLESVLRHWSTHVDGNVQLHILKNLSIKAAT